MAVIGKIINESGEIKERAGEVVADVIINKNIFQLRTYAMGDDNRENGSKQNIQLNIDNAVELRELLDKFIG